MSAQGSLLSFINSGISMKYLSQKNYQLRSVLVYDNQIYFRFLLKQQYIR